MKKLLILLASALALFGQSAGVGQIWTLLGPTTLQNAATASGNGTNMAVGGMSSVIFAVNCSVSCAGGTTINFEASDATTNFTSVTAVQVGTGTLATSVANQNSGSVTFWQTPIGAFVNIRARISGYSSGTITVTATASAAPYDPKWVNDNLFIGGTAIDANSGNKSAATPRMVIATDQPNLTTALNVAIAGNQATNVAQINGVTPLMGNGVTGTGSQRVTIASDNTAFSVNATLGAETTKVIGTVRIQGNVGGVLDSAPDATAPANVLNVAGRFVTTPATLTSGQAGSLQLTAAQNLKTDMSTVAGTVTVTAAAGVQKVGIVGNANAAIDAATGAAPPANAILMGGLTSGATGGLVTAIPVCDSFQNVNHVTASTFLEVTGVSGRHVRICSISLVAAGADNVAIISGTGATCGTGSAAIVGTTSATGFNFAANGGISQGSGIGTIMRTVATGDSVCIITSAAVQLSGVISFAIY